MKLLPLVLLIIFLPACSKNDSEPGPSNISKPDPVFSIPLVRYFDGSSTSFEFFKKYSGASSIPDTTYSLNTAIAVSIRVTTDPATGMSAFGMPTQTMFRHRSAGQVGPELPVGTDTVAYDARLSAGGSFRAPTYAPRYVEISMNPAGDSLFLLDYEGNMGQVYRIEHRFAGRLRRQ